ncbi:tetratricopeptide repeat protein [Robertkochia flava]|uniref:tetratricopeptide repeat protein n=1 Tax=Robertkochia flava TaxID=3447986 RepID=UPI001CCB4899|nr:tetratricopeptide repeat protein [Robertkochia marina]
MKRTFLIFFMLLLSLSGYCQAEDAMAKVYMDKGEYEKALFYYEKLFESNPYNMNYLGALVKCYQQLEQTEKAEVLLKDQLSRPRIPPAVHIELGYNYSLMGEEALAKEQYDLAMASIELNPSYAYMVGQGFRSKQLLEEAVKAFKKGMELNPKLNFNYDLAYIYGEQGDLEQMYNTYLDLILERTNLKENIKRNIGRFLFEDGSSQGNEVLRKVLLQRVQSDPNIVWNELLSWLFIQQKQYSNALSQEKAIYKRSEEPHLDGIRDLGLIAYSDGENGVAGEAFEFIVKNSGDPSYRGQADYYLMKIAVAEMEEGQEETLLTAFDNLLDEYGRDQTTVGLQVLRANFMAFHAGLPEEAVADLKALMELPMDRYSLATVKMELADILVYQELFNQALIYYSQVQKELKNDVTGQMARFKVARTSFYKGDFDWAESQLKVLKSSTSQLIANDALQLKLIISDNSVQDSLQTALKTYARAHLLAYQEQDEAAIATIDDILKNHKGEAIEDEALMMQAGLFEKLGDYERAELNYLKVIEFFPQDIFMDDALYRLSELYLGELNEPEKAKPLLERLIFDHQDSIYFPEARKKFRELRGDPVN